jgi:hypothetical protein
MEGEETLRSQSFNAISPLCEKDSNSLMAWVLVKSLIPWFFLASRLPARLIRATSQKDGFLGMIGLLKEGFLAIGFPCSPQQPVAI